MSHQTVREVINLMHFMVKDELPEPLYDVGEVEDTLVEMRDGIKLMTRSIYPEGQGPWPVILVRNPYSPVNSDEAMQQPVFVLVKYGYAVVYQQVRGSFESEGAWLPFENERNDGMDTLIWLIQQPWMDGNIGTFGGSYLGHVQWCLGDLLPPQVKTMYFSIYGGDPYEGYYQNGMFKLGGWSFWAMEMMKPHRNLDVDPVAVRKESIERFIKMLTIKPHVNVDEFLFGEEFEWYRNWIRNPYPTDSYWTKGNWGTYRDILSKINIPIMFQTGWFDFFFNSMIKSYERLPKCVQEKSRMVISPWHHGNVVGGDLDYPNDNILGMGLVKDALEWFDHFLKDKPYSHSLGVVEACDIGMGRWKTIQDWLKPMGVKMLYLYKTENNGIGIGELTQFPTEKETTTGYLYDPNNPVITRGGNLLINYPNLDEIADTSINQEEPGSREDVISFLSTPLEEELKITGSIRVNLFVSSDAQDTSFAVKVIEMFKNGKANNIQDSIQTLVLRYADHVEAYNPGDIVKISFNITPTLWTLQKGSRIRVDVTSSNFPAYHIHPNIAGIWSEIDEVRIANQTLYMGGKFNSSVEIPFS